nr:iq domain-containing protein iqm2 [Quercus suber]
MLIEVLPRAWKAIPRHCFEGALESMPHRIEAVIAAQDRADETRNRRLRSAALTFVAWRQCVSRWRSLFSIGSRAFPPGADQICRNSAGSYWTGISISASAAGFYCWFRLDPAHLSAYMEAPANRPRALSHREYLDALPSPSLEEIQRISAIQVEKEVLVDRKYHNHGTRHTTEEHEAATKIQRIYRGHRERRQMDGLTLDPSARWTEAIRVMRYRAATHLINNDRNRPRAGSGLANWQRATKIVAHAGAGENPAPLSPESSGPDTASSLISPQQPDTMTMDMRYFLEMVDPKHRYGANLQIYHAEWLQSRTKQNFFLWLDHGEGRSISLPLCDRAKLEHEQIRYLNREERKNYLVRVDDEGKLRWDRNGQYITTSADLYKDTMSGIIPKDADGVMFSDESVQQELSRQRRFARKLARLSIPKPVDPTRFSSSTESSPDSSDSDSDSDADSPTFLAASTSPPSVTDTPQHKFHLTPTAVLNHLLRASIRPGTWIYVADTLGRLYVGIKASGSFQHASFLSGARISSAGSIGIENGQLTYLSPLSGHYRPTTKSFRGFVDGLRAQGVDLRRLRVSNAYPVLLGLEVYGKMGKGWRGRRRRKHRDGRYEDCTSPLDLGKLEESAVDVVQRHWEEAGHEKG